ncbi:MAG: type 4a pilus biogenesis protein PilO [Burkholderiaceae bacterium]|jgi:type IV pilus assembly protein PilO|nr:type 4a pilus biogenesis protein PilO [Burkholderiaceae bacterium]
MARKSSKEKLDFSRLQRRLVAQFQGLDARDPGAWPAIPKFALLLVVAIAVAVVVYFLVVQESISTLNDARSKEGVLRGDYHKKLQQAVSLDELKKQREQVSQYVSLLERQLPSKAEMDALLSDINQAGLGRSLQFDLFRPAQVSAKAYYAELPIELRVTGQYHDIGAFTADVANLSRIVTLNNINIWRKGNDPTGALQFSAIAKTFRYLDPDEVAAQRGREARR